MTGFGTGTFGTGAFGTARAAVVTPPVVVPPDPVEPNPVDYGGFPERVLEALGPAMRELAGPLLPPLVAALTAELTATDDLLTVPDTPLGSAPLADVDTSPYPRWLAQLAGVRIPGAMTTEEARAFIRGRGVSRRGTPGAIKAAAASTLTGSRRVALIERDGSPWRLRLITYVPQTPDPAATLAAAMTEKPVGLMLTHELRNGQSWGDVRDSGQILGDLERQTVRQLRETVPSG